VPVPGPAGKDRGVECVHGPGRTAGSKRIAGLTKMAADHTVPGGTIQRVGCSVKRAIVSKSWS
jgi:hypothetical protein